ncbi:hypothetical protein BU24DRAFT_352441, partial [Aaosphaeria arxii CBS 175.79]
VAILHGDLMIGDLVVLEQEHEVASTLITWNIRGHDANVEHAFHIHKYGDNTNGCTSAGPRYSMGTTTHMPLTCRPRICRTQRWYLGNFKSISIGSFSDILVKLSGSYSILGRTLVVHAGKDDLGRGQKPEPEITINASARPICGTMPNFLCATLFA